jgi:hypothetical protein
MHHFSSYPRPHPRPEALTHRQRWAQKTHIWNTSDLDQPHHTHHSSLLHDSPQLRRSMTDRPLPSIGGRCEHVTVPGERGELGGSEWCRRGCEGLLIKAVRYDRGTVDSINHHVHSRGRIGSTLTRSCLPARTASASACNPITHTHTASQCLERVCSECVQ